MNGDTNRDTTGDTVGFHCNACGKCCNSAPAMSVPELFAHRERFIGSLAVARVPRLAAGGRIAEGNGTRTLDDADAADLATLRAALFHESGGRGTGDLVSLVTQGLDYPSLGRCPALGADGGCAVHGEGKPAMCSVVPLDPHLPDRLQRGVLLNRRASGAYLGATCIVPEGETPGVETPGVATPGATAPYRPLVRHDRVVDAGYHADLQRRRDDLVQEKARWGRAVFGMLEREFASGAARLPGGDGYLVLPLAPVLAVLAAESPAMRAACVAYIDAQLALIDASVAAALARKRPEDRALTAQLRGFAQVYARQRPLLARAA
jgi:Fe-S-cluster containining protein